MSSEPAFQLDAALRIRLLLVDDEPDFKEVMLKHLSRRGIRLSVAECCLDALDELDTAPADVVIMDMHMPGENGIQCLRKVKERWPLTEVIILTGHASVQSGMEGMQSGAFDYCIKPIDVRELLEKVELAAQKALINREDAQAS
ncbi:response regulator [uncultured Desulfobulbus sp.]|uniref:response regulator n=1 Tax=uncultured Desulfobulbus sp. TaxID=239745 RepID=UPI0026279670|nr:response regulator [uncultured Desulfobulbus sp.]